HRTLGGRRIMKKKSGIGLGLGHGLVVLLARTGERDRAEQQRGERRREGKFAHGNGILADGRLSIGVTATGVHRPEVIAQEPAESCSAGGALASSVSHDGRRRRADRHLKTCIDYARMPLRNEQGRRASANRRNDMAHRGFWRELKRRHVYRVAAAYAIVGWLLIQGVTQVFPIFHLPDWIDQAIVLLILIGFPIALVLAWAFDATPQGIVLTDVQDSADVQPSSRSHRAVLVVGLIGALIAFLAGAGWWHAERGRLVAPAAHDKASTVSVATPSAASTAAVVSAAKPRVIPASSIAAQPIPAKSIAVLPFENLSQDKDNAYFADGMQDLILTKLADIGDLKVISRTSTAKYESHPDNLKVIAQQLGVASILEGSVQKAGNQVLINVQLINASSDSHIWAESYTRTLDNIFGVEGEVAQKVADALQAKLTPKETAQLATAMSSDAAANDLFLRAEYFANQGNTDHDPTSFRRAIPICRQALAKDSGFALARARLSFAESGAVWFGSGGDDIRRLIADAQAQAEQALAQQPRLVAAQVAIGYSAYWGRGDFARALQAFDAALALRPNDADALGGKGFVLRRQGDFAAAIAALTRALELDPRDISLLNSLGETFSAVSRYAQAAPLFQRALDLDP